MAKFILAFDQGTTSSRACIYDQTGKLLAAAQQEVQLYTPHTDWVEQDPEALWYSQYHTALEVMEKAGLLASDIACIGITNQRETTIVWDRQTGKAIYPAIVWQDGRTAGACAQITDAALLEYIQQTTGLMPAAYFSASKIAWILDHVDGARAKANNGQLCFGTVDSWLLYKLTQGATHSIEASNASRTLLMNLQTRTWDAKMLELFDIPSSMLPTISASCGNLGHSALFGNVAIPITGILGDQQAALLGQHCIAQGDVKTTYGTGCFMLQNTGQTMVYSSHKLLTTLAWDIPTSFATQLGFGTQFAIEGSVFMGGAIIKWLRDNLGVIDKAEQINTLAAQVPDSDGVYIVPAFVGLGAPYWSNNISASISGLHIGSNKSHLARAVLDAIVYQVADVLQAMQQDITWQLGCFKVDGGAAVSDLLMQLQADCLGLSIHRPASIETTVYGAALMAAIGAGLVLGADEFATTALTATRIIPSEQQGQILAAYQLWRENILKLL